MAASVEVVTRLDQGPFGQRAAEFAQVENMTPHARCTAKCIRMLTQAKSFFMAFEKHSKVEPSHDRFRSLRNLTLLIQELKAVDPLEGFNASPLPHNALIAISKEADVVIPHPVPLAHLIVREALSSLCFQKLSELPPALGRVALGGQDEACLIIQGTILIIQNSLSSFLQALELGSSSTSLRSFFHRSYSSSSSSLSELQVELPVSMPGR